MSSGAIPVFDNRVGWTQSELKHSGLIESTRRGYFKITDRGLEALSQHVTIDKRFLRQYPEYLDYIHSTKKVLRIRKLNTLSIQIILLKKSLRIVIKRLIMF